MKVLTIGRLNKRIMFLRFGDATDALGQDCKAWENYKEVWATFKPIRGGEFVEADRKKREEVTYKATVRYLPGISADMRIRFKERIFEIISVINVEEANYMLEIECREYVEKKVKI